MKNCKADGTVLQPFLLLEILESVYFCICESKRDKFTMKSKSKKKQHFSSVKALLKADREKEIEQYGKQVSMRPSKVHKSKKDYDRRKNKVDKRELD